jgi:hypothetical protein
MDFVYDDDVAMYARNAVLASHNSGVLQGGWDDWRLDFRPKESIARDEFAGILYRFVVANSLHESTSEDSVIVALKQSHSRISPIELEGLFDGMGFTIITDHTSDAFSKYSKSSDIYFYRVLELGLKVDGETNIKGAIRELNQQDFILYAGHKYIRCEYSTSFAVDEDPHQLVRIADTISIGENFAPDMLGVCLKRRYSGFDPKLLESIFKDMGIAEINDITRDVFEQYKDKGLLWDTEMFFSRILFLALEEHGKANVLETIHRLEKLDLVESVGLNLLRPISGTE